MLIKRGDIFYADLSPIIGSEQDGIRPVLVIQNDTGNKYSPTVITVPISSKKKNSLPVHVPLSGTEVLPKESMILTEQIRTLDRRRLKKYGQAEYAAEILKQITEKMLSAGIITDEQKKRLDKLNTEDCYSRYCTVLAA